jgi:hypothetical protein
VSFGPVEGARSALQEETKPLVLGRVRAVLCLGLVGILLSVLFDVRAGGPELRRLLTVKAALVPLYAAMAWALGRVRTWRWDAAVAVAVAGGGLICAANAVIGIVAGDVAMAVYVLTVFTMGGAVVLPWGVRPQLALVGVSLVGLLAAAVAAPQAWRDTPNLAVAVVSAFAASVYVAATLDRQRLERKAAELLQAGHKRVLELIARDAPLGDVLEEIVRMAEEPAPGML